MNRRINGSWLSLVTLAGLALVLVSCAPNRPVQTVAAQERTVPASRWSPGEYAAMGERGQKVFAAQCARCHTVNGLANTPGPDLSDYGNEGWTHVLTADFVLDAQRYYPGTKMPQFGEKVAQKKDEALMEQQINDVAAYVSGLRERAEYLPQNQSANPAK